MTLAVRITARSSGPDATLNAWSQALASPGPALEAVGEVFIDHLEERFQSETDPYGAGWAPLSPVTIRLRAAAGKLGKILQRDRILANSKFARLVDATTLVVGLATPYAKAMHFGNPRNRMFGKALAPIPPRPLLPNSAKGLPRALRDEIIETFRDAIREVVARRRAA